MIPHNCTGPDCYGCHVKSIQFRPAPAFQPHYNYSVGRYVETERSFKDTLKREAEANTIATGTDHNYEMVDPGTLREQTPFPQSDAILDTQGREIAKKYAN